MMASPSPLGPAPTSSSSSSQQKIRPLAARPIAPLAARPSSSVKTVNFSLPPSGVANLAPSPTLAPAKSSSTSASPRQPGPVSQHSNLTSSLKPALSSTTVSVGSNSGSSAGSPPSAISPPLLAAKGVAPIGKKKDGQGPLVQPSKDWVLPARAKPGRKPSEAEPPTKRKAQNRASQRAFRERKQSYLASLEAKVAAYEKAEVEHSIELQKVAKRLKEENDALKKENQTLKERFVKLEAAFKELRLAASKASIRTAPQPANLGCKAPSHEVPPVRQKRSLPSRALPSNSQTSTGSPVPTPSASSPSSAGIAIAPPTPAIMMGVKQEPLQTGSPSMSVDSMSTSSLREVSPIKEKPSAPSLLSAESLPPNQDQPTMQEIIRPAVVGLPSLPSAAAAVDPPSPSRACRAESSGTTRGLGKSSSLTSPQLMLNDGGHIHAFDDMDRGCGFCIESSPCVCSGEAVLRLDDDDEPAQNSSQKPEHKSSTSTTTAATKSEQARSINAAAVPLRKLGSSRSSQNHSPTTASSSSMSVDSLLSSDPRQKPKKTLWFTEPAAEGSKDSLKGMVCPTPDSRPSSAHLSQASRSEPQSRPKAKLWPTVPFIAPSVSLSSSSTTASSAEAKDPARQSPMACTGDPSTCGACSSDPDLAAFCEAVTSSINGSRPGTTLLDAGNAVPLNRGKPRPGLTWRNTTNPAESSSRHGQEMSRGSSLISSLPSSQASQKVWETRPVAGFSPARSAFDNSSPHSPSSPSAYAINLRGRSRAPSIGGGGGGRQSIPEAFRQIRNHPRFNQWEGGLSLLADVVSRRASPARPPSTHLSIAREGGSLVGERKRMERVASVEIETSLENRKKGVESSDRTTTMPTRNAASSSDTSSLYKPRSGVDDARSVNRAVDGDEDVEMKNEEEDEDEAGPNKRRRIYVEKEAVKEALALLDRGSRIFNGRVGQRDGTSDPSGPCPCPWWKKE
ncbi:hypothetical protein IE53DRAFT_168141 [Violaceomyces palustris]|uniref:Uncharacterized protein n=1 Tax=Violaceomyces palustris TaxID=1673888 RepID=A0ACD0P634_9BASI|nr:hypothetical protein IE53DRAFT_168141 [Violaceomyces palustris]